MEIRPEKDHEGRDSPAYLVHFLVSPFVGFSFDTYVVGSLFFSFYFIFFIFCRQGWSSAWDQYVSHEYLLKYTDKNRKLQKNLVKKAMAKKLLAYVYIIVNHDWIVVGGWSFILYILIES